MSDQKLLDLVEGNARVINEIYESVMTLRKAVAIVQTLLEEQLEDPEEQLKKVGLRHAIRYPLPSWSVLESLLKALDQVEERPDAGAGGEDLEDDPNDAEEKKYVEPITIAEKLELQIGMFNGHHNDEFCLHTMHHLTRETGSDGLTPFWTTRLKTDELKELREAIDEALLTASRFNPPPDDSVDIDPETTADKGTLSAPAGTKRS
jgi:hypothetical protein